MYANISSQYWLWFINYINPNMSIIAVLVQKRSLIRTSCEKPLSIPLQQVGIFVVNVEEIDRVVFCSELTCYLFYFKTSSFNDLTTLYIVSWKVH